MTTATLIAKPVPQSDNPLHRSLFSLPPLRPSEQTLPAVPTLPPKQRVTGDKEVDAVLWLREVIGTGDAALITQAQEAAKKIRTPLKELENRYANHMIDASGGQPFAALASFGFADLNKLAERSIKRRALQVEAQGRFGDTLFDNTPAEVFCISALKGLEPQEDLFYQIDPVEAETRFRWHPAEMPHTLADCLHELAYWHDLAGLRYAFGTASGDPLHEVDARECFVFSLLAEIPPRNRSEARSVLDYLYAARRMDAMETRAIFANLVG